MSVRKHAFFLKNKQKKSSANFWKLSRIQKVVVHNKISYTDEKPNQTTNIEKNKQTNKTTPGLEKSNYYQKSPEVTSIGEDSNKHFLIQ